MTAPLPHRLRSTWARALCWATLGLSAAALPSCSAGGGGSLRSPVPLVRERFVAPAGVLRVRWHKQLIESIPWFSYKPQEFGVAATSDDGRAVYVGASSKRFYAFSARTGEVLWDRELEGAIAGEPLYLPGGTQLPGAAVLVGDDSGTLHALDAETGKTIWKYTGTAPIEAQPTVQAGTVYVTTAAGRIYALDLKSGKWRWQYERDAPDAFAIRGHSGVLITGARAYVGFPDGYLAALASDSGEVLWTKQLSSEATRFMDVDSTPLLFDGTLYVSCYAQGVFGLDPKDGSTRWRFDIEAAGPLAADPENGRIYAVSASQGLYCLDTKGRKIWQQHLSQAGELSMPRLWGRYLLVSAAATGLHVFDKKTGELLQYFDPGQGATARPSAHGSEVYLLSNAGAFFAFTTG